ncbi:MAG: glycosyltransferase family 1 protein [Muribaculaceae bacterium]
MKVLFIGDASNFHITLARALNDMGHTAVVASNGSGWMNTDRNIDLFRPSGAIGALKYLYKVIRALPKMRGYDIVHINNPIFMNLRPAKVRMIFDYIKRNNGKIFLSALGTDSNYVKECLNCTTFRYSDFKIGNEDSPSAIDDKALIASWLAPEMIEHTQYIINEVNGIVACLYEYNETYKHIAPLKLGYAGIPIDTRAITPNYIDKEPEKVKFFIGIQRDRSKLKGTDIMLNALRNVHQRFPDKSEICVVENMPYDEYVRLLSQSHVILDQLYSYTPATNALIAMAQGLIAVSGAEPEYYDFIGETENQPIINVSPLDNEEIERKLEWIILNKSKLPEMSHHSREFVVKHNDSHIIAQRHIDFWNAH